MQKYKKFEELSDNEISILKEQWILNWYWPEIKEWYSLIHKIWLKILRYSLKRISIHFSEANANKHDYWYYIWWDEERRLECDSKFFFFICKDIEWLRVNIFKKTYLYFLAFIFFVSVRAFWWKYFNYKKEL